MDTSPPQPFLSLELPGETDRLPGVTVKPYALLSRIAAPNSLSTAGSRVMAGVHELSAPVLQTDGWEARRPENLRQHT